MRDGAKERRRDGETKGMRESDLVGLVKYVLDIGQKKSLPGGRLNHYRTTSTFKTHFLGDVTCFGKRYFSFFLESDVIYSKSDL